MFASWVEAFPDGEAYPLDARGCDDDRVFVRVRMAGHGAESGIPFEMEVGHVVTLDDGEIRRLEVYLNPADALESRWPLGVANVAGELWNSSTD